MDVRPLDIPEVLVLTPPRFGDARGWFSETYNAPKWKAAGVGVDFVQDNQSFSAAKGTLRGLHFQAPPHAQDKLVRCPKGRIWDVAVDFRAGSPTFGRWVGAELTAEKGEQIFVPAGFLHGFVTLEADCEVAYKVSDVYAPQSDGGVIWNDPDIGIDWPIDPQTVTLSAKDAELPR
ncbi:MAG: dTDP-4-dehydrorhamnose 3,5-epimerase, partial [Pseudomonadota bacterium]